MWIVDLPGLGRSPFQKEKNTMTIYLQAVKDMLTQAFEGAHLIGHSFGAIALMAAFKENYFRQRDTITLLQPPVMKKSTATYPGFMKKWVLKNASLNRLEKYVLETGVFGSSEQIPANYIAKVKNSFTSPRILNTTVQLDGWLSKKNGMDINDVVSRSFQIIWGNQDKVYQMPTKLENITQVPYGHHFPLSHPNETAHVIVEKEEHTKRVIIV